MLDGVLVLQRSWSVRTGNVLRVLFLDVDALLFISSDIYLRSADIGPLLGCRPFIYLLVACCSLNPKPYYLL